MKYYNTVMKIHVWILVYYCFEL